MKKSKVLRFIKKYRARFIAALIRSILIVNIYRFYQYTYRINNLKYYIYPDLPGDIRGSLIEQARSALVLKTNIISMIILLASFFPMLMLRFKVDQYESIFNCYKRFKKENEETNEEDKTSI